jgi:acetyl-CoA carboxylase biotin carboxyl carrier protein
MHELDETRQEEARQQSLPLEEVERLVDLVRESGVGEIRVRQGEVEIVVKASPGVPVSGKAAQAEPRVAQEPAEIQPSAVERDGLHAVRSPLVGTFYRAPAPGEEPYVEVGDRVRSGQALCIVEAMKLMNEIPADISGEVVEILVENAEGVEYDQPLFRLRPEE